MKFKIDIKSEKINNRRIGKLTLSKMIDYNHFEVLAISMLNEECLLKLEILNGFIFEHSEEEHNKQKKDFIMNLLRGRAVNN